MPQPRSGWSRSARRRSERFRTPVGGIVGSTSSMSGLASDREWDGDGKVWRVSTEQDSSVPGKKVARAWERSGEVKTGSTPNTAGKSPMATCSCCCTSIWKVTALPLRPRGYRSPRRRGVSTEHRRPPGSRGQSPDGVVRSRRLRHAQRGPILRGEDVAKQPQVKRLVVTLVHAG